MGKALSGELSCPCDRSCLFYHFQPPGLAGVGHRYYFSASCGSSSIINFVYDTKFANERSAEIN